MGLDDAAIRRHGRWLRLAFALCTILAAVGVVTAQPAILWILLPIAMLGVIFPIHPFDLIYNFGIRHLTGTGPLPRRGAPSRFACGLGSAMVLATALAFETGHMMAGYFIGGVMIGVATLVSTTDICIPSLIYRSIFGFPPKADSAGNIIEISPHTPKA
jgi:hypothetical protein